MTTMDPIKETKTQPAAPEKKKLSANAFLLLLFVAWVLFSIYTGSSNSPL